MKRLGSFLFFALGAFAFASQSPPDLGGERVELVGKLHAARMAIGGETTGVTLNAPDGTHYELLVKDAKLAKRLDGHQVKVTGKLRIARGVEVPIRRIVDVGSLDAR